MSLPICQASLMPSRCPILKHTPTSLFAPLEVFEEPQWTRTNTDADAHTRIHTLSFNNTTDVRPSLCAHTHVHTHPRSQTAPV